MSKTAQARPLPQASGGRQGLGGEAPWATKETLLFRVIFRDEKGLSRVRDGQEKPGGEAGI